MILLLFGLISFPHTAERRGSPHSSRSIGFSDPSVDLFDSLLQYVLEDSPVGVAINGNIGISSPVSSLTGTSWIKRLANFTTSA
jgi:hypothetical protein